MSTYAKIKELLRELGFDQDQVVKVVIEDRGKDLQLTVLVRAAEGQAPTGRIYGLNGSTPVVATTVFIQPDSGDQSAWTPTEDGLLARDQHGKWITGYEA